MSFLRKLVSVLWVEFLLFFFVFLFHFVLKFEIVYSMLYSLFVYVLLLFFVRFFSLFHINKGAKLMYKKEYRAALVELEKSYRFFSKHEWIDKHRNIFMLLTTKFSNLELSLSQMIACSMQLGETEKAKEYYQILFEKFPQSYLTEVASKNLNLTESKPEEAK